MLISHGIVTFLQHIRLRGPQHSDDMRSVNRDVQVFGPKTTALENVFRSCPLETRKCWISRLCYQALGMCSFLISRSVSIMAMLQQLGSFPVFCLGQSKRNHVK